jgi:hypothetical protein
MADRLRIYNGALLICSERQLDLANGLTELREPRFLLDLVWNDGFPRAVLEGAQWHFAMRSARLDYEPSIQPDWGFNRAFTKPTDWVLTSGVFQDERMLSPLTAYADERGYWFTDLDQIFVKYVSDDPVYGGDLSRWPQSFVEYVKAFMAEKIIRKLPGGMDRVADVEKVLAKALITAKNRTAMTQPTTFPTRGTWARARLGGRRLLGTFDGGNQNQLIG